MTEGRRSKTSLNTAEINFDEVYTNYADKNISCKYINQSQRFSKEDLSAPFSSLSTNMIIKTFLEK